MSCGTPGPAVKSGHRILAFTLALGVAGGCYLGLLSMRSPRHFKRAGAGPAPKPTETPADIQLAAWIQVAGRTCAAFTHDQIPAVAAGVTFFSLLAICPALGAFVSLYGLVANVEDARRQILGLSGLLPGGALSVIGDQMTRLASANHAHLGVAFAGGLLISIWSANAGVKALISGLNVAYEARETRKFIGLNLLSLSFTVGLTAFAVIAVAAIAAAPKVLAAVGLASFRGEGFLRWPVVLGVAIGLLELLYRFGPSRDQARWRWITPGSALAAFGWVAMSLLFSLYVANFGHYDRTYGSLGAIVGFMTWIWLSAIVVLVGAELNSQLEWQARITKTTGAAVAANRPR